MGYTVMLYLTEHLPEIAPCSDKIAINTVQEIRKIIFFLLRNLGCFAEEFCCPFLPAATPTSTVIDVSTCPARGGVGKSSLHFNHV